MERMVHALAASNDFISIVIGLSSTRDHGFHCVTVIWIGISTLRTSAVKEILQWQMDSSLAILSACNSIRTEK